jgi:hypothetical protein
MENFHKYRCIVHQPKSIIRQPNKFHSTPRTVTEENQKFWKGDAPLGASICKDCYMEKMNQQISKNKQTETSPGENMV